MFRSPLNHLRSAHQTLHKLKPLLQGPLNLRRPARLVLITIKTAAVGHIFMQYICTPLPVGGPSMLPTLAIAGDWVLIDHRYRHGRNVQVGDLVGFDIPSHYHDWGLKRVLGMPGDYVVMHPSENPPGRNNPMVQIPEGHCWVAGDNLTVSRDSRLYGPVPLASIKGKCVARLLPARDRGWIAPGLQSVQRSKPVELQD